MNDHRTDKQSFSLGSVTKEKDIVEVIRLAQMIWREHYTAMIGEEQVSYMLLHFQSKEVVKRQIEKDGYLYFLMKRDGKDVGYLSLRFEENSCFLSKIYILKEHRQKGYARAALSEIEKLCKKKVTNTIWLTVNIHNEHSITAYQKLGFLVKEKKCTDIGGGFFMDDYIMEKIL